MNNRRPSKNASTDLQQWVGDLFDQHAAALTLYAKSLCTDPEDVVQEAFLRLARNRHSVENPLAWLFAVVRNESKQLMRARSRRNDRHRQVCDAKPDCWFERPEDSLLAGEVVEALQKLEAEQRELITMRVWGELSFREIGAVLGVSDSAAHRRFTLAMESLQTLLGEDQS